MKGRMSTLPRVCGLLVGLAQASAQAGFGVCIDEVGVRGTKLNEDADCDVCTGTVNTFSSENRVSTACKPLGLCQKAWNDTSPSTNTASGYCGPVHKIEFPNGNI